MSNKHARLITPSSILAVFGAFAAVSSPCAAQNTVTIPERTEVKLSLMADMRSGDAKENSEVVFEVEKEVKDEKGNLLIKAHTPAYGKVTKSKRRGAFGAPGKLNFTCDYVQMENGAKVSLRATSLSSYGRDNRTATVATAVLLAPLALFVHGRGCDREKGDGVRHVCGQNDVGRP